MHDKIDLFATDGYFIPFSVALTPRVMRALDEAFVYGRTFYSNDYQDEVDAFLRGEREPQETTFLATE